MHIIDGFARAGIHPYNPATPLNSSLIKYTNDLIVHLGTAPCPKHVFLKYFSIKAELLAIDITADSGSKFYIGNI